MVDPAQGTRLDCLAIGGCHRDLVGRTDAAFEPATSCPGKITETSGGVARNVAVLMANAGLTVALATRIGDDAAGRALSAALRSAGVRTELVDVDPAAATGTYIALHDRSGELAAALSDLSIYDAIRPEALPRAAIADAGLVFADANLPAATLEALSALAPRTLAVDAISRAKAPRVAAPLRAGALVFVNRTSAEALSGRPFTSAIEAAATLAAAGARRLVVTDGGRPLAVLDDGGVDELPVPAADVADVTGAGDALIAGTLLSLIGGRRLIDALSGGIAASQAALAVRGALPALPAALVAAIRNGTMQTGVPR
ncbi:PfkB family carbohydrate kinase [Chthonobacter albigriseus]|uniref:PfkB family carbohydrate kinase n=1 Tax=Chthonobacter albigriseus TaxID=1683161 RepID=UPI0015EEA37C|nr:PfkB family carbohydrate kinase [Chthonobacter albigriseus]